MLPGWFSLSLQSLIHSAKRCCYRNSICNGVPRLRIFFLCTSLSYVICKQCIRLFVILLVKTDTHYMYRSRMRYYCKGLSTNSLYMIKCKAYIGFRASLTFQFGLRSVTERRFEKKDTRWITRLIQTNIGNYWLQYKVTIFP